MNRKISILGSTGSIGVQTLEVISNLGLELVGISGHSNIDLLEKQVREYKPKIVCIKNKELENELTKRLSGIKIEICSGIDGLVKIAELEENDVVVNSVVGSAGLLPTIKAIRKGKNIALANKETLVTAGKIIMDEAREHNVNVVPIDSEHSAIFQCLVGNDRKQLSKIILTASGGPFRGKTIEDLKKVKLEDALKHPNWTMGSKITIDSSTLMNKGLEVIEAKWLFDLKLEEIDVIVHPQSIIHSMVEYEDGSIMAQLGSPDMRIPIQYALAYPDRVNNNFSKLDLLKSNNLTFEKPDYEMFKCLKLAFESLKVGGTMPVVLNAANEVAVSLFLQRKIEYLDIPRIVEESMLKHNVVKEPSLEEIMELDKMIKIELTKIT